MNVKDTLDRWGLTPIHRIVLGLDEGKLDEHLRLYFDLREKRDWQGRTPLHWAAIRGNHEILQTLVTFKVDPSAPDMDQITPLHLAANYSSVECVNVLLEAGANPNAVSHYLSTPLHFAVRGRPREGTVRALIIHGANLEIKDKYGQTALYFALVNNCIQIVPTLLELGANIEAEDKMGITPVQACVKLCHAGMIRFLRNHGARMDHINGTGNNILHIAASYADNETLIALDHDSVVGLTPVEKNSDGKTPEALLKERCEMSVVTETTRSLFRTLLVRCRGRPSNEVDGGDTESTDSNEDGSPMEATWESQSFDDEHDEDIDKFYDTVQEITLEDS